MERHNAVVQVFVQTNQFNWSEPYKTTSSDNAYGTAFFIDDQGHLVSNFHVINGATSIDVQMPALGKQRLDVTIINIFFFFFIYLI